MLHVCRFGWTARPVIEYRQAVLTNPFNLADGSAMRRGFEVLGQIDQAIARSIGDGQYRSMLDGIQQLMQTLEAEEPAWCLTERN